MLKFLQSEKTINISGRLNCDVTAFSSYFSNESTTTKFVMTTGRIESNGNVLSAEATAAVLTSPVKITGAGIVISTPGFSAQEEKVCMFKPARPGQLSYIDGCSNTNLVDPARNGDPCLNYLFFPENVDQTFHTHPSIRIGYVLSGRGKASLNDKELPLEAGAMFILERHARHRFCTGDSHMSLMVFHPDSEDGPTDEFNPMKSRTYIQR